MVIWAAAISTALEALEATETGAAYRRLLDTFSIIPHISYSQSTAHILSSPPPRFWTSMDWAMPFNCQLLSYQTCHAGLFVPAAL